MADPADIEEVMLEVKEAIDGNGQAADKRSFITYIISNSDESDIQQLNLLWPVEPEVPVSSNRKIIGPALIFVKRLMRKSLRWQIRPIVIRIHSFHGMVVNILNRYNLRLNTAETRLAEQETVNLQTERQIKKLAGVLDQAFDKRLEKVERSVKNISRAMKDLIKDETLFQHQEVTIREVQNLDYIGFENQYRGQEELIRERQSQFLRFFSGKNKVADIGCGRGEFLELLRDNGIQAQGIDFDEDMVERCKEKGLKVIKAEALSYLRSVKDETLGGIFLGQVVEHLTPSELVELTELSYDKLSRDSYVVIETINPLCLSVFANTFYLDISHQKPVHPHFLSFHLQSLGFRNVELIFLSPVDENVKLRMIDESTGLSHDKLILNENLEKLNKLLFSHQDYALAAKK